MSGVFIVRRNTRKNGVLYLGHRGWTKDRDHRARLFFDRDAAENAARDAQLPPWSVWTIEQLA